MPNLSFAGYRPKLFGQCLQYPQIFPSTGFCLELHCVDFRYGQTQRVEAKTGSPARIFKKGSSKWGSSMGGSCSGVSAKRRA